MKTAVICAGGPETEIPDLTEFMLTETVFIGADRGTMHLLARGIVPQEAVGDFDSVTAAEFKSIEAAVNKVGCFRAEKDETDTELALVSALSYHPDEVILTGVTGGRLDHMQSALQLLYRVQVDHEKIRFSIRNRTNELRILTAGMHIIHKDSGLPYCSFFPFAGTVSGLSLKGFKYEATKEVLDTGMTKFTSNEPVEEVCTISFQEGICLMVRSSDS